MSKKCEGDCKRYVDEYYILKKGMILCYDCYTRELNYNKMLNHNEIQEKSRYYKNLRNQIANLDIEINVEKSKPEYRKWENSEKFEEKPNNYYTINVLEQKKYRLEDQERNAFNLMPYDYTKFLDNAIFYDKQSAIRLEEYEKQKAEKELELRIKKTKEEAIILFKKIKKQFSGNIFNLAKERIEAISTLIKKNNFEDYKKALELLKKEYDWDFNKKETFSSSLADYDKSKLEFEQLRDKTIKNANNLLQSFCNDVLQTKNYHYNLENNKNEHIIDIVNELLVEGTYKSALEAINLIEKEYSWVTKEGTEFQASFKHFKIRLETAIKKEKEKEREKKEIDKKIKQQKEEAEQRHQEYKDRIARNKTITISVIIILIILFISFPLFRKIVLIILFIAFLILTR